MLKTRIKNAFMIVIVTLLVLLSNFNCVNAETIYTEGAINYVIRDGKIIIINYFGDSSNVIIPEMIGGYYVKAIESQALTAEQVNYVEVPESIEVIAEDALNVGTKLARYNSEDKIVSEEIIGGSSDIKENNNEANEKPDEEVIVGELEEELGDDIFEGAEGSLEEETIIDSEPSIEVEETPTSNEELPEVVYSKKVSIKETRSYWYIYVLIGFGVCAACYLFIKKHMKSKKKGIN